MTTLTLDQPIRTASGKEKALADFLAQLRRDHNARPHVYPATLTELAQRARIGRAYLSRVLNCDPKASGLNTWKHVIPLLSLPALFQLKQCSAWNVEAATALHEYAASFSQ